MTTLSLILLIIGAICFFVDAAKISTPLNLFSLGWGFVVASVATGNVN